MIVIPMVGESRRFREVGYARPKYELKIFGSDIFENSVRSFEKYFDSELFVFVVRKDFGGKAFVRKRANEIGVRFFYIKELDGITAGQAVTVYEGVKDFSDSELLIFNIDTIRRGFVGLEKFRQFDGVLEVFKGEGSNWSFVEGNEDCRVVRTTEKDPISNLCSDGLYYFKSSESFIGVVDDWVHKNRRVKNELYVAPLYNDLIAQGADISYSVVENNNVVFCGTPDEYEALKEAEND